MKGTTMEDITTLDLPRSTEPDGDEVRRAEAEVQQVLTESQTQALYRALVSSRIEVARLQAQLAAATAAE